MNEQIEKLAEQCYETGPIGKDGWPEYSKFNYKKFSELIVQECILTIQMGITRDGYDTEKYQRSMKHIKQIREHFGVEE
jgi:hypothetical protein